MYGTPTLHQSPCCKHRELLFHAGVDRIRLLPSASFRVQTEQVEKCRRRAKIRCCVDPSEICGSGSDSYVCGVMCVRDVGGVGVMGVYV